MPSLVDQVFGEERGRSGKEAERRVEEAIVCDSVSCSTIDI